MQWVETYAQSSRPGADGKFALVEVMQLVDSQGNIVTSFSKNADLTTSAEVGNSDVVTSENAGDLNVQTVYSASVTLTDAQIKALQQTDVQLVAAQGPNTLIIPTDFIWDLNPSGGAYTNVTAFETVAKIADFGVDVGYVEADQGFFALTGRIFIRVPPAIGINGVLGAVGFADATCINQPLMLTASNAAAGNLTGGHASNTLKITVSYMVVSTS